MARRVGGYLPRVHWVSLMQSSGSIGLLTKGALGVIDAKLRRYGPGGQGLLTKGALGVIDAELRRYRVTYRGCTGCH